MANSPARRKVVMRIESPVTSLSWISPGAKRGETMNAVESKLLTDLAAQAGLVFWVAGKLAVARMDPV
ncbi:MAG: hypothetical protein M3077_01015 [Candidatus Dormibacteraeota bacterium]|nr:hypothetical protein [Candidatus Dormibacteraeota bacterium]